MNYEGLHSAFEVLCWVLTGQKPYFTPVHRAFCAVHRPVFLLNKTCGVAADLGILTTFVDVCYRILI